MRRITFVNPIHTRRRAYLGRRPRRWSCPPRGSERAPERGPGGSPVGRVAGKRDVVQPSSADEHAPVS